MSDITALSPARAGSAAGPRAVALPPFTVGQVLPWLVVTALFLVVGWYFVSAEQGATALFAGNAVHEWVHDSRHLLGFPCH